MSHHLIKGFAHQVPPDKFELFPKLVVELRLKIWKLTIDDIPSRIVSPKPKASGSTVPAILHTRQESRNGTQKTYHRFEKHDPETSHAFFINLEIHTVYLNHVYPLAFYDERRGGTWNGCCYLRGHESDYPDWERRARNLAIGILQPPNRCAVCATERERSLCDWLHEACPDVAALSLIINIDREEDGDFRGLVTYYENTRGLASIEDILSSRYISAWRKKDYKDIEKRLLEVSRDKTHTIQIQLLSSLSI
jgi:hypothetical protein